jgi:phytanoyl-CoA hydroxylase
MNMQDIKSKYQENGYVLVRNLVDIESIDRFIDSFNNKILEGDNYSLPRMDTQKFGNIEQKNGYMQNPIADIHLMGIIEPSLKETCDLALEIITSNSIQGCLKNIHSSDEFSLVMSMFFDQNSGTPAHQDSYYLDSLPHGNLTGVWIALEDIDKRAGRFYVIPKSQNHFFELSLDEIRISDAYEKIVHDYIIEEDIQVYAPALKKGDVIFWNSHTIHGSSKILDENFSRKSLTAHFVPKTHKYVQNRYTPEIRSTEGFIYNNVQCKVTNSVDKKPSNKNLVSTSTEVFNTQDFNNYE